MEESILTSIKKLIGIEEDYDHFDTDIIIHINTAFANLRRLGVGPSKGFSIRDKSAGWYDFTNNDIKLESVKTYVYIKVKLIFDPPTNSFVMESMKNTASELEWCLKEESGS